VEVEDEGLRRIPGALPAGRPWRVYGDSQVLGMNVDAGETWAAAARAQGLPVEVAGIPGDGVEDALRRAAMEVGPGDRVVFVVNAANDWAEWGVSIKARYTLRGGWLVTPAAGEGPQGRFFATPLARSHLLVWGMTLVFRDWKADPAAARLADSPWGTDEAERSRRGRAMGEALVAFRVGHPGVDVGVAYLPVDFEAAPARARMVLPEARADGVIAAVSAGPCPWEAAREPLVAAHVPMADLGAVLSEPGDFLDGDYHLSPQAHAKVGEMLARWLDVENAL
jgi:hypothetical protein